MKGGRRFASTAAKCSNTFVTVLIGLYHQQDGVTDPKYKLLHLLTKNISLANGKRH
jgi:hypothetical protein